MKITRGPNQLAQQANDEGGPRHIKHKQTLMTRDRTKRQIKKISRRPTDSELRIQVQASGKRTVIRTWDDLDDVVVVGFPEVPRLRTFLKAVAKDQQEVVYNKLYFLPSLTPPPPPP